MNHIRAFGLIAVAALIATALLGSGSASATVLCQLEEETCSTESTLAANTTLSASLKAETTATFGPVSCRQSTLKGETLSKESESLSSKVSELTFAECTLGANSCTLTAQHLSYGTSIKYTETGNGTMPVESGTGGSPSGQLICGSVKCTYTVEATLDVTGGEPGELVASKEPLKKTEGGLLCPTSSSWSATYLMSAPKQAFVEKTSAATNTVLCKLVPEEVAGTLVCPKGEFYAGEIEGTLLENQGMRFAIAGTLEWITCTKANLAGSFKKDGTSAAEGGGITSFKFESAGGKCSSNMFGNPEVVVEMKKTPYTKSKFVYIQKIPWQGVLPFAKNRGAPELFLNIEGIKCNYKLTGSNHPMANGGALSIVTFFDIWTLKEKEPMGCPAVLEQDGEINIFRQGGSPFYIAEK